MKSNEMVSASIAERYQKAIVGELSCVDRVIIRGTLPDCCHPAAMTKQMFLRGERLFNYGNVVMGYAQEIRARAAEVARQHQLEIEFIRRVEAFRKEDRIAEKLRERGDSPGLVHIFSAMERCQTFKPWRDANTGQTTLRWDSGKCLHYYFYFIDEELGLCFLRVPTWAPFTLQFYCNGHQWLQRGLQAKAIDYRCADNAFVQIEDWEAAQQIARELSSQRLHEKLDQLARLYTPLAGHFEAGWHWPLAQVEYSTDLVFRDQAALGPLYQELVRTAIHAIKADDVATFLGRRGLSPLFEGKAGTRMQLRIEGTRIRHCLGPVSIKMYDKGGRILRIETTCNDVSFFQHQRSVNRRDGTSEMKVASVRKTIHSLPLLIKMMEAANRRYLAFISQFDDHRSGKTNLDRITATKRDQDGRTSRGFNLFAEKDLAVIYALLRGEHHISGIKNSYLPERLHLTPGQISRILKRLRRHGIIRKVGHRYKYYLTKIGHALLTAALKLREFLLIPSLQTSQP